MITVFILMISKDGVDGRRPQASRFPWFVYVSFFFFLHDPLRLSSSRLTSNKHHRRTNKNKRTRETRNGKIEPNVDRLRLPSVRKDATTKKESEKEKKCYKRKRKGAVRKGKKKKKKKKNSRNCSFFFFFCSGPFSCLLLQKKNTKIQHSCVKWRTLSLSLCWRLPSFILLHTTGC